MAKNIYILRHGLTESNKKRIYAGWSDESLCEEGITNLKEIGKRLRVFNIEKIYSSPIQRAIQTAEIINGALNTEINIEEDLREMKMGPWEGLSEEEVAIKYPIEWKVWNSTPSKLKLKGRETLKVLQARILHAIAKILSCNNTSEVLVVTHVAPIRIIIIHYNNLSMDDFRKITIPNGSVYLLNKKTKKKKIERIL